MSAKNRPKTIYQECHDIRTTWRELWYNMADGVQIEYEKIKGLDVLEFWAVFNMWREKIKKDTNNYNKNGKRK